MSLSLGVAMVAIMSISAAIGYAAVMTRSRRLDDLERNPGPVTWTPEALDRLAAAVLDEGEPDYHHHPSFQHWNGDVIDNAGRCRSHRHGRAHYRPRQP